MHYLFVISASKAEAEHFYQQLCQLFEEEAYPIAVNEAERDSALYQVSLYLEENQLPNGNTALFAKKIASYLGLNPEDVHSEILEEQNWVEQSLNMLQPIRVAGFFIYGAHDKTKKHPEEIGIHIEANQAFGTGHHETTFGCLFLLEKFFSISMPQHILDLGCGTGILAIAAAKLAQKANIKSTILASDIDPIATKIANENFICNGVVPYCTAITAEGFNHACLKKQSHFDLIIANILANPLVALASAIKHHNSPNGGVILSGILEEQLGKILNAYQREGFSLKDCYKMNGWVSLYLQSS